MGKLTDAKVLRSLLEEWVRDFLGLDLLSLERIGGNLLLAKSLSFGRFLCNWFSRLQRNFNNNYYQSYIRLTLVQHFESSRHDSPFQGKLTAPLGNGTVRSIGTDSCA